MNIRAKQLAHLRYILNFHADHLIMPRSSAYDLFLTCLALIFSKQPNVMEYGPFMGETSFYIGQLANIKQEKTFLVDNFIQGTDFLEYKDTVINSIKDKIKVNMTFINNPDYEIIMQDAISNPVVDKNAGFIFWDICYGNKISEAIINIMNNYNTPTMLVVDDVSKLVHSANAEMIDKWREQLKEGFPYKPFLATYNRVFYSNFEIDHRFKEIIKLLINSNYLKNYNDEEMFKMYPNTKIVSCKEHIPTFDTHFLGGRYFLNDSAIWDNMTNIINS